MKTKLHQILITIHIVFACTIMANSNTYNHLKYSKTKIFSTLNEGNLVLNPSAETPPLDSGWTQVSGDWQQSSTFSGSPTAQDGDGGYFYAGVNSFAELYQDIDLSSFASEIDAGNKTFTFSCYLRSYDQVNPDESKVTVAYKDAAGVVLDTYDTGFSNNRNQWVEFTDTRDAPINTRSVTITLISQRNSGNQNDGYIDNIYFGEQSSVLNTNNFELKNIDIYVVKNQLKINKLQQGKTNLKIYSILGQEVLSKSFNTTTNVEVMLPNLNTGVYIVTLQNNQHSIRKKVFINTY